MARRHGEPKGASPIRTAHGDGAHLLEVIEVPVLDERRPLNAGDTAQGLTLAAGRGKPFTKGNRAAQNRKPALALLGVPLETTDPTYRSNLRKANSYRQRRTRELAVQYGGYLGAGPSAMLASAALALAASRTMYALAGEALSAGERKTATELFASASRLADSSRQQELTASALAEREAAARPKVWLDPLAHIKVDDDLNDDGQDGNQ